MNELAPTDAAAGALRRRHALLAARGAHWRRTRTLTALLLLVWLATSFGTIFFARELAALSLFGWPLSFYLAAQGASLIYLAILLVYALAMRRLDLRFQRRTREQA
jgi:putative solute:sodium symporter small subunit